ncbi:BZ3500_MvSof-1268-A1-R1_Chr5-1g07590 [Microbotryum saponariae]|uniref:BZ3500_MvSof-1268-A1-R1_Chr5-1g07590 protein n=1 Tax=Microbotryum saponariae TaxID=289078 RepID=A0A2X0L774_9BASI|nr:BZ3500_MvSof-1268-A1-R1_Chr5-1g07590 [Microbotryum saponariae]SDA05461.1 BZ3501_MvSof-1269-A2-R1_Chr5-2g07414 [Microbotryum saponariae]
MPDPPGAMRPRPTTRWVVRLDYETLRQKTFQAIGIVPSSKSSRRLMVLMYDASAPMLESVGVLKEDSAHASLEGAFTFEVLVKATIMVLQQPRRAFITPWTRNGRVAELGVVYVPAPHDSVF